MSLKPKPSKKKRVSKPKGPEGYYEMLYREKRERKNLFALSTASDGYQMSQFENGFGNLLQKRLADKNIVLKGWEISDFRRPTKPGDEPWLLLSLTFDNPKHAIVRLGEIQSQVERIFPPHSDIRCNVGDISIWDDSINIKMSAVINGLFDDYDDRAAYNKALRKLREGKR